MCVENIDMTYKYKVGYIASYCIKGVMNWLFKLYYIVVWGQLMTFAWILHSKNIKTNKYSSHYFQIHYIHHILFWTQKH